MDNNLIYEPICMKKTNFVIQKSMKWMFYFKNYDLSIDMIKISIHLLLYDVDHRDFDLLNLEKLVKYESVLLFYLMWIYD